MRAQCLVLKSHKKLSLSHAFQKPLYGGTRMAPWNTDARRDKYRGLQQISQPYEKLEARLS